MFTAIAKRRKFVNESHFFPKLFLVLPRRCAVKTTHGGILCIICVWIRELNNFLLHNRICIWINKHEKSNSFLLQIKNCKVENEMFPKK